MLHNVNNSTGAVTNTAAALSPQEYKVLTLDHRDLSYANCIAALFQLVNRLSTMQSAKRN